MPKEKKVERIVIPCTPSFKKKYLKICERQETDMASFGMSAITDKIRRENLEVKDD